MFLFYRFFWRILDVELCWTTLHKRQDLCADQQIRVFQDHPMVRVATWADTQTTGALPCLGEMMGKKMVGVKPTDGWWWNMVLFGICVLLKNGKFSSKTKGGKTSGISPAPVIFTTVPEVGVMGGGVRRIVLLGASPGKMFIKCKSSQTNLKSGQLGKLGMISHRQPWPRAYEHLLSFTTIRSEHGFNCRNGLRWIPIH